MSIQRTCYMARAQPAARSAHAEGRGEPPQREEHAGDASERNLRDLKWECLTYTTIKTKRSVSTLRKMQSFKLNSVNVVRSPNNTLKILSIQTVLKE